MMLYIRILFFLLFFNICNFIYGDEYKMNQIVNVRVNNNDFKLVLYDNDTARDFLSLLPLNINMNDLNRNEKYYYLDKNLKTKTESINNIKTGDFMLYGNNCIVLFYESFRTSYKYTKIGYIENFDNLKNILGYDDVYIHFSID